MFSRRHPYLFFILVLSALFAATVMGIGLMVVSGRLGTGLEFGENVGVIPINGIIADAAPTIDSLKAFRQDDSIRAIVLRIDSPGGAVGPSQEIYREVQKTVPVKKVVVSMGAVAASGGYYIASAADGIMANPGTITGSIGVIMSFTNFRDLMEKIGLHPVVVKSGTYKDIGSPTRKMTDAEKQMLQQFVDQIRDQFISAVAMGRKKDPKTIRTLADGRIFTGQTAQKLGLVDRLGNLQDAIQWAGRLGGIKGKITAVQAPEKKMSFLKYLAESIAQVTDLRTAALPFAGYLWQPADER